jgi:phosphopantetheinyl transferase (holo-ACP synthase)
MPRLPQSVAKEIRRFAKTRVELAAEYERRDQLETAYLARWAILERFVKAVVVEYRRQKLKRVLREWLAYLDGKHSTQPREKPDVRLDANHFPERSEFIAALRYFGFDGAAVWKVMDSNGKPRGFRNKIAHTGRKFTKPLQYHKLKKHLESATKKTIGI